jgi:hypothetical protein
MPCTHARARPPPAPCRHLVTARRRSERSSHPERAAPAARSCRGAYPVHAPSDQYGSRSGQACVRGARRPQRSGNSSSISSGINTRTPSRTKSAWCTPAVRTAAMLLSVRRHPARGCKPFYVSLHQCAPDRRAHQVDSGASNRKARQVKTFRQAPDHWPAWCHASLSASSTASSSSLTLGDPRQSDVRRAGCTATDICLRARSPAYRAYFAAATS